MAKLKRWLESMGCQKYLIVGIPIYAATVGIIYLMARLLMMLMGFRAELSIFALLKAAMVVDWIILAVHYMSHEDFTDDEA